MSIVFAVLAALWAGLAAYTSTTDHHAAFAIQVAVALLNALASIQNMILESEARHVRSR